MEIILDKNRCTSLTGRISPLTGWYIRQIHGRFFTVCNSPYPKYWRVTVPLFYKVLSDFKDSGFIQDIILNKKEKEVLLYAK